MITLRRVKDPVTLSCPYCDAPILTFDENEGHLAVDRAPLEHSDIISDMLGRLSPEQLVPNGFQCVLDVASGRCCKRLFFFVDAIMVNRNLDPNANNADNEFISTYFFFNGDRGRPTHFMASRGKREWPVQRFESPLGPVLHHYFGPFRWIEKTLTGADGTTESDKGKGNWDYARRVLLALWDDLQALSAATK
jgi:hypothetical protein